MRSRIAFEAEHWQTFEVGMLVKGVFSGTRIGKVGDDEENLDYTIEFDYTPRKSKKKPAYIRIRMNAVTTPLSEPQATTEGTKDIKGKK